MSILSAKLSRRLGLAVQSAELVERQELWLALDQINGAAEFHHFNQLPDDVQKLVKELEARGGVIVEDDDSDAMIAAVDPQSATPKTSEPTTVPDAPLSAPYSKAGG